MRLSEIINKERKKLLAAQQMLIEQLSDVWNVGISNGKLTLSRPGWTGPVMFGPSYHAEIHGSTRDEREADCAAYYEKHAGVKPISVNEHEEPHSQEYTMIFASLNDAFTGVMTYYGYDVAYGSYDDNLEFFDVEQLAEQIENLTLA